MCLGGLITDIYFTSDDYLYQKKCSSKLNFKSPLSRQYFSYYFPANKMVNDKVYFEKNNKNNFRIIYNLDGFDEDGFEKEGFDRNGFNRKGFDGDSYNSNKKEKPKQAIIENPNTYQYATLRLKHNIDLAIFFHEKVAHFL